MSVHVETNNFIQTIQKLYKLSKSPAGHDRTFYYKNKFNNIPFPLNRIKLIGICPASRAFGKY